ncbi:precorrin-3B synthase [Actinoplanes friuliensis]|uniref:precorrin-3B synthase n=1 Tax=Actinoplanes friuliensis TaxID=196914 RepID=UPI0005A07A71|nr:precorrin-3B synthase [Actinoplanes friuliensis]
MPQPSPRADADACPGALRLHAAADGPLARVRLPGGRLTGAQLAALRVLAQQWGDGHAELTSRANLQLRALEDVPVDQLAARLRSAGLLPSDTHELVRNIAASPLAGGPDVAGLDQALCADPRLASLPGRFLFALDSGAGDVAFPADVAALPLPDQGDVAILFAGTDAGLRVPTGEVIPALLAAAHAFLDERTAQQQGADRVAWRVRELTDGPARVAARTAATLGRSLGERVRLTRPPVREPIGAIAQPDGRRAVGALVPLGRLTAVQMKVLSGAAALVVTPWRGIVVPDLPASEVEGWVEALRDAGLEVSAGSRWVGVSACAGRPGCAKSLADVRADADAATTAGEGLPVHWVGCERGCGSPAGPHVRVEATGTGYEVRSPEFSGSAPAGAVGALVGAARKG